MSETSRDFTPGAVTGHRGGTARNTYQIHENRGKQERYENPIVVTVHTHVNADELNRLTVTAYPIEAWVFDSESKAGVDRVGRHWPSFRASSSKVGQLLGAGARLRQT